MFRFVGSVVDWLEPVIVIDMVSVQHLLAPFCCVFENDTIRHFSYLMILGSSSKFQSYLYKKLKNQNKNFSTRPQYRASPEAGRTLVGVLACLIY